MNGFVVFGLVLAVLFAISFFLSRRAASRRASRALYAHSEPGGPHTHAHEGASGMAAAKLADIRNDGWSG